jgi:hypothetical protein
LAYHVPARTKRGGVVSLQDQTPERGFTTEDILWAIGIWSVILCLSPVIIFYMLMVA